MTTVGNFTNSMYTKVGVFRNAFPVARYFFDIHVGDEGFAGFYMWKRNDYRFPIYHHIKDRMRRGGRNSKEIDQAVSVDDKNFYVKFEDVQGVVTDSTHKEIQILSAEEEMTFIFRPYDDYNAFIETLKEKLGKKYFTRDNVEIEHSVYI